MITIEYLESERQLIWSKISELESLINAKTTDDESIARAASRKATELKNKSESTFNLITKLFNESSNTADNIDKIQSSITDIQASITENYGEIKSITENSTAKLTAINSAYEVLSDKLDTINAILENLDDTEIKYNKLTETFTKSEELKSKIETAHKSSLSKTKEIDDLYYDLFGYTDTDEHGEEIRVEGKVAQLDNAYSELSEDFKTLKRRIQEFEVKTKDEQAKFIDEAKNEYAISYTYWTEGYSLMISQLENLLPRATTTGLSFAYHEKKKNEEIECKNLVSKFEHWIYILIFISIVPFMVSIYFLLTGKKLDQVILDMPRIILAIVPLYIPALWVAYSTSKKINLSKRLIEEYTHKEVLSKTFEGLSNQISTISNQDICSDLKTKLLYNLLHANSENPGKLISDYNKADHPLIDALDKSVKLADSAQKLYDMPGFRKLAERYVEKSKKLREEQNQKAEQGLDEISDDDSKV